MAVQGLNEEHVVTVAYPGGNVGLKEPKPPPNPGKPAEAPPLVPKPNWSAAPIAG
jgi:hypothetical protein